MRRVMTDEMTYMDGYELRPWYSTYLESQYDLVGRSHRLDGPGCRYLLLLLPPFRQGGLLNSRDSGSVMPRLGTTMTLIPEDVLSFLAPGSLERRSYAHLIPGHWCPLCSRRPGSPRPGGRNHEESH